MPKTWWCKFCHQAVKVMTGGEGTSFFYCDWCGEAVDAYKSSSKISTDTFNIQLSESKSAAKITTNYLTLIEVFAPDLPKLLIKSLDDLIEELDQLKSEVFENWEELE